MEYTSLYIAFMRLKLKSMLEHRGAFWAMSVTKASLWIVDLILIWIVVDRFQSIGGWKPFEVLLLYGLNMGSYSLAAFFLYHPFTKLAYRIQTGEFDEILTKPTNPFLYLISKEVSAGYFSNVTVATTVIVLCFFNIPIAVSFRNIMWILITLASGALIQGAMLIISSVPSFWTVENRGLVRFLVFDFRRFVQYPISIYPKAIQIILTFVLPYAFINFYPAHVFINNRELHGGFVYITPLVGITLFFIAYHFWKFGLRNYQSTGS